MKTSLKSKKTASVLKQQLPFLFQKLTNPDEFGFLTIIDIDVSIDKKYADVFIKSLGGKKGFLKRLNALAPKISHELVQIMPFMKKIELRFKQDISAKILDKLQ